MTQPALSIADHARRARESGRRGAAADAAAERSTVGWGFLRLRAPGGGLMTGRRLRVRLWRPEQAGGRGGAAGAMGGDYGVADAWRAWRSTQPRPGADAAERRRAAATAKRLGSSEAWLEVEVDAPPRVEPAVVTGAGERPGGRGFGEVPSGAGGGWEVRGDAEGIVALAAAAGGAGGDGAGARAGAGGSSALFRLGPGGPRAPLGGLGHPHAGRGGPADAAAAAAAAPGSGPSLPAPPGPPAGCGVPRAFREPDEPCDLPNRLHCSLPGSARGVMALSFSPCGAWLALAAGGAPRAEVRIHRVSDGALARTLRGHHGYVYELTWRPDSGAVATASADLTCKVWSLADAPNATAAAARGRDVDDDDAAAEPPRASAAVNDAVDDAPGTAVLRHDSPVYAAAFAPAGSPAARGRPAGVVATCARGGDLRLWCPASGHVLARLDLGQGAPATAAAWHPLGARLWAAVDGGAASGGARVVEAEVAASASPDPAVDAPVLVLHEVGRSAPHSLDRSGAGAPVSALVAHPGGRRVLAADRGSGLCFLASPGLAPARRLRGLQCESTPIRPAASPDGRWVLSGSECGSTLVWDAESGAAHRVEGGWGGAGPGAGTGAGAAVGAAPVLAAAWSPVDHVVATCSLQPQAPVQIWRADPSRPGPTLRVLGGDRDGAHVRPRQRPRPDVAAAAADAAAASGLGAPEDSLGLLVGAGPDLDRPGLRARGSDGADGVLGGTLSPADVRRLLLRLRARVQAKPWYDEAEFADLSRGLPGESLVAATRAAPGGRGGGGRAGRRGRGSDGGRRAARVPPAGREGAVELGAAAPIDALTAAPRPSFALLSRGTGRAGGDGEDPRRAAPRPGSPADGGGRRVARGVPGTAGRGLSRSLRRRSRKFPRPAARITLEMSHHLVRVWSPGCPRLAASRSQGLLGRRRPPARRPRQRAPRLSEQLGHARGSRRPPRVPGERLRRRRRRAARGCTVGGQDPPEFPSSSPRARSSSAAPAAADVPPTPNPVIPSPTPRSAPAARAAASRPSMALRCAACGSLTR